MRILDLTKDTPEIKEIPKGKIIFTRKKKKTQPPTIIFKPEQYLKQLIK